MTDQIQLVVNGELRVGQVPLEIVVDIPLVDVMNRAADLIDRRADLAPYSRQIKSNEITNQGDTK